MSGTTDPFDVQVGQWVAKAKGNAEAALKAIAEDAVARVKELTPVRTGYLRANWTAVIGGEPLERSVVSDVLGTGLATVGGSYAGRMAASAVVSLIPEAAAFSTAASFVGGEVGTGLAVGAFNLGMGQDAGNVPADIAGRLVGAEIGGAIGFAVAGPGGAAAGEFVGAEVGAVVADQATSQPPPLSTSFAPYSGILGQTITILNPVVYARRVEFGFVGTDSLGRHYNQAGAGMMQQTIAEMPQISQAAVARVMAG